MIYTRDSRKTVNFESEGMVVGVVLRRQMNRHLQQKRERRALPLLAVTAPPMLALVFFPPAFGISLVALPIVRGVYTPFQVRLPHSTPRVPLQKVLAQSPALDGLSKHVSRQSIRFERRLSRSIIVGPTSSELLNGPCAPHHRRRSFEHDFTEEPETNEPAHRLLHPLAP